MEAKNVWSILGKQDYTKEGQKEMEEIYDFLVAMIDANGENRMQKLSAYFNRYTESFRILDSLLHEQNAADTTNNISAFDERMLSNAR